jgi:hypothetical protein
MVNLCLYKKLGEGAESLVGSGFQPIHHKDVSARPVCINWVLRSTLR